MSSANTPTSAYFLRLMQMSPAPTPYRVICTNCDHDHQVAYYLTYAAFNHQNKSKAWMCPACGGPAEFDYITFENATS